jgi:GH35 family endo-1,4-beta-xylanase
MIRLFDLTSRKVALSMKKPFAVWLASLLVISLALPAFTFSSPSVAFATEGIDTPRKDFPIGNGGDSPFGANVQAAARYQNIGQATVPFDRSQELGIGWNREELRWDIVEPNPGRFDWRRTDIAIDESVRRNIQIIGLLCYNVSNVNGANQGNFNMPDIGAWRNYIAQVVRRYSNRVKHWEIWNEPENHTGAVRPTFVQCLRGYQRN